MSRIGKVKLKAINGDAATPFAQYGQGEKRGLKILGLFETIGTRFHLTSLDVFVRAFRDWEIGDEHQAHQMHTVFLEEPRAIHLWVLGYAECLLARNGQPSAFAPREAAE